MSNVEFDVDERFSTLMHWYIRTKRQSWTRWVLNIASNWDLPNLTFHVQFLTIEHIHGSQIRHFVLSVVCVPDDQGNQSTGRKMKFSPNWRLIRSSCKTSPENFSAASEPKQKSWSKFRSVPKNRKPEMQKNKFRLQTCGQFFWREIQTNVQF